MGFPTLLSLDYKVVFTERWEAWVSGKQLRAREANVRLHQDLCSGSVCGSFGRGGSGWVGGSTTAFEQEEQRVPLGSGA